MIDGILMVQRRSAGGIAGVEPFYPGFDDLSRRQKGSQRLRSEKRM
jgi:hypothetical protein